MVGSTWERPVRGGSFMILVVCEQTTLVACKVLVLVDDEYPHSVGVVAMCDFNHIKKNYERVL